MWTVRVTRRLAGWSFFRRGKPVPPRLVARSAARPGRGLLKRPVSL